MGESERMIVYLLRRYRIECAHNLNGLRPGHRCGRVHGHNYTIELEVTGELDDKGMVIDAEDLDTCVRPVLARLDHRHLNELGQGDEGVRASFFPLVQQPTAENIAIYLWNALGFLSNSGRYRLTLVRVRENEDLAAEVRR